MGLPVLHDDILLILQLLRLVLAGARAFRRCQAVFDIIQIRRHCVLLLILAVWRHIVIINLEEVALAFYDLLLPYVALRSVTGRLGDVRLLDQLLVAL